MAGDIFDDKIEKTNSSNKMQRMKVLVFPCGSEIGLEVYRSLWCAKEVDLWGGSSISDHGRFVFKQYIPDIPFVNGNDFLPAVNKIIREYGFEYVIPAHDDAVLKLAKAYDEGNLACKVLTSPYQTCKITRSKKSTIDVVKGEILTPQVYDNISQVDTWPIFIKPDVGQGSKGTVLAQSIEDAKYSLGKDSNLLIMEYLPGKEYTIDCFTNRHGTLIFCRGRERSRISNGISTNTSPVDLPTITLTAEKLNSIFTFRGVWFFQVKENVCGELALLEVSPRLAGTMGMFRNLGVNFLLMALYDSEGFDVTPLVNETAIEMDRALTGKFKLDLRYTDVYLDYDDCLVLNERLNVQVVTFIYQCIDKGMGVHLLTRHSGNLMEKLNKLRLAQVFDSIVQLNKVGRKSDHIESSQAIFIDDSFAERREVSEKLGIAVFAPDSVESLLE